MKAHELAKKLLDLPNYEIILSSDQEGNSYGTIDDYEHYSSIGVIDKDLEDWGLRKPVIILSPFYERLDLDEI